MLFNMVGYRFVFSVLDDIATEKLDAKLDAGDYAEENLIEIKVPLNMPYQDRVTEFERHYGEITIEGNIRLILALKSDENPGVKKEAMKVLQKFPFDEQVKKAVVIKVEPRRTDGPQLLPR